MAVKATLFKSFSTNLSKKQITDAGMAMVLILLLIGFFTGNTLYYKIAIPVLVINMSIPKIFYPLAIAWFGLSHLLGSIMSKILLTLVFVIFVLPVGLMRKILGKDAMLVTQWKKGTGSVMKERHKIFSPDDLEKPY